MIVWRNTANSSKLVWHSLNLCLKAKKKIQTLFTVACRGCKRKGRRNITHRDKYGIASEKIPTNAHTHTNARARIMNQVPPMKTHIFLASRSSNATTTGPQWCNNNRNAKEQWSLDWTKNQCVSFIDCASRFYLLLASLFEISHSVESTQRLSKFM